MGLAMEHGSPYSRAGGSPRDCWYYLRYFFLFISLIQFLIILGLVLFMVYGNVHESTESNLQATKRRAEGLYNQVVGLTASQANLSKELNLTARTKDAIMQMLLNARRDADRINASLRQCQAERVVDINNKRYMATIIQSEEKCKEQLKESNKSCNALLFTLTQKSKTLEEELAKGKTACTKEKDSLGTSKQVVEEQLAKCNRDREQQWQLRQQAENQLKKVQSLCLQLDHSKFTKDVVDVWRSFINSHFFDTYTSYHPSWRGCDNLPNLLTTKVEDLVRSLRAGIENVARENSDLQRQMLEAEQSLRACQEAKEKAEKEAHAREAKLQGDYLQQAHLMLEHKAALRKEIDSLAKELEEKKREAEQLKMQLAGSNSDLETCIRAKSQQMFVSRSLGPVPNIQTIVDAAGLEEFKRRILESQRLPASNSVPSSG